MYCGFERYAAVIDGAWAFQAHTQLRLLGVQLMAMALNIDVDCDFRVILLLPLPFIISLSAFVLPRAAGKTRCAPVRAVGCQPDSTGAKPVKTNGDFGHMKLRSIPCVDFHWHYHWSASMGST